MEYYDRRRDSAPAPQGLIVQWEMQTLMSYSNSIEGGHLKWVEVTVLYTEVTVFVGTLLPAASKMHRRILGAWCSCDPPT